ncbi:uncharacterized protein PGRI_074090 [Penicillium griseofulvum]|uniref:DUF7587 domain-containing protein n=1 Tax=Penicillium patulum TaxID=5078 RepID=A0A135LZA2_PENPA|nr:uncharacterized protein PGRI_074090 [Penicillium griseofulvum]KXG54265.1 hypothetical protein PGRI_074090 [Penicillium griseofulvum]
MEGYCVPQTQLPERLYRVQYDKSTTKDMEPGLAATDMQHFTVVPTEFGTLVERHINNLNDQGNNIFISTFSSKAKADDWMCRKWRSYGKGAQILEIETKNLGHGYVYRAGAVAHALKLNVSFTTYDDLCSEYLIFHFVPARAIVARLATMIVLSLGHLDGYHLLGSVKPSDRKHLLGCVNPSDGQYLLRCNKHSDGQHVLEHDSDFLFAITAPADSLSW